MASTAESTLLTKNEATDDTSDGDFPAEINLRNPSKYESITFPYIFKEKIKVTFTLIPSEISSVIANKPSSVPGTLIIKFFRLI